MYQALKITTSDRGSITRGNSRLFTKKYELIDEELHHAVDNPIYEMRLLSS